MASKYSSESLTMQRCSCKLCKFARRHSAINAFFYSPRRAASAQGARVEFGGGAARGPCMQRQLSGSSRAVHMDSRSAGAPGSPPPRPPARPPPPAPGGGMHAEGATGAGGAPGVLFGSSVGFCPERHSSPCSATSTAAAVYYPYIYSPVAHAVSCTPTAPFR